MPGRPKPNFLCRTPPSYRRLVQLGPGEKSFGSNKMLPKFQFYDILAYNYSHVKRKLTRREGIRWLSLMYRK